MHLVQINILVINEEKVVHALEIKGLAQKSPHFALKMHALLRMLSAAIA